MSSRGSNAQTSESRLPYGVLASKGIYGTETGLVIRTGQPRPFFLAVPAFA
jgi:hypothetical protein